VLLERLGEGGMGQVFKARSWKLGRVVAVKLIGKDRLGNPETLRRFQREVRSAAALFHPHIVRALDADGLIKVWDASTGAVRATLRGHSGEVSAVAFSPDGKVLASASADGTVRLWEVASGRPKGILRGHGGPIGVVAFTPDGTTLATAEHDGVVRLWDTPTADRPAR
jgi:WD40 repeat protein